uniref:NADH dehydrogenase subunit 11 n=1 Tax=Coscinodiscus wailesii TaxID=671091 RepID=A0A7T8G4R9_9STRA|nr:NADH dehydrogenase subunit 11 [Coscinodiscus wailesii]QQP21857.1 NADH dehydrogenase subunit 11 [Coscinodiscus wailesii]
MKYFYINNKKYKLSSNIHSIIAYCENLGITIPHFCYHKKLSIAGNCRMCLIEVKNSPKPIVACSMSVTNKMEIYTDSPLVKKARENVIEFLLLNHPLDCPVCDQGGECDLQDQAFYFGSTQKRFYNYKRIVTNKNLGVLIKTVMTRCIHCTRCVRFSNEIAGTSELGVFGRGMTSEIGTYLNKNFSSELSGNVIDICPVGALTSKPYPFVKRSWELKVVKSFDFTDSFGINILIYLKDNLIVKVLSNSNIDSQDFQNYWLSDKTRFSFNGMFSPERITETFLVFKKSIIKKTWKNLIKELVLNIYFYDQLKKHLFKKFHITLLINTEISFEIMLILIGLKKQYNFIQIRKLDTYKIKTNLESSFTTNSINDIKFNDFCCLLNVNLRYENSYFNIKLRQRYLKGNFKVLTLGSNFNNTYPFKTLGFNINLLKNIAEGNNTICQEIITARKPLVVLGSSLFNRNDTYGITNTLDLLKKIKPILALNTLNVSLTESTISYITKLKEYSSIDYNMSSVLYLININLKTSKLNNLIKVKLLHYYNKNIVFKKIMIQQNNSFFLNNYFKVMKEYDSYIFYNLPNKVFFEESAIMLTNEGILKKKIKIVKNNNTIEKSNWSLIRNFFNILSKINFLNDINKYKKVVCLYKKFRSNLHILKIFYFPKKTKFIFDSYLKVNDPLMISQQKYSKKKTPILKTKGYFWIEDFFIGGKDSYSKLSTIMIKCSKKLRITSTNFML